MSREKDPSQKLYPKLWMMGPWRKDTPMPLPPMPALEELVPEGRGREELTEQPTVPLISPADKTDLAGQAAEPQLRAAQQADPRPKSATMKLAKGPETLSQSEYTNRHRTIPWRKSRERKRRSRRTHVVLVTLLLALVVFGGVACCGFYFLETNLLGPLGQFFHPLNGESTRAIDGHAWNLLLLGSDNDNKFVFPEVLTQVMMVVRIDPTNNSIYMVSIPRDSWVSIPGAAGMYKIDQAFYLGSTSHHSFDDGVRLARATIEQDYGIPIDRYAWVGLEGFASVIDTLGGLNIDLIHPILDDTYPDDTGKGADPQNPYALKRLYLEPGPQHLNGEQALEYVRSRHADLVGDIGRTQRQQQVLAALKQKLNVPNIFNHLSELFRDLKGKVYTNLNESEMLSVANFGRSLPTNAIRRLTLGPGQGSQNYGSLSNINDPNLGNTQDVIIPNCATIQPAINRIFGLGNAQSCQVNGPGS